MALTLTEKFRMQSGGRKFMFIQVTHDETTSNFTAASVDMTYIEFAMQGTMYLASTPADTSTYVNYNTVSILLEGSTVEWPLPPKAGSKSNLMLIGW